MASKVQAILARDVTNLGHVGDVVRVAPGYLRNFLTPKLLALPVSRTRLEQFDHQKKLVLHQLSKLKAASEEVRDRIEVQKFTIEVKAGEQGKLFGSVGGRDIEKVLKDNGFTISHKDIKLADGPLKTVGIHDVPVRLEGGVMAKIKVIVAAMAEPVQETDAEEEDEALEAVASEDAADEGENA